MTRNELISELLESGEPRTEHGWDKAIDLVLEIIDEKETAYKDVKADFFNTNTEKQNFDLGWVSCAKEIRWAVKGLRGKQE